MAVKGNLSTRESTNDHYKRLSGFEREKKVLQGFPGEKRLLLRGQRAEKEEVGKENCLTQCTSQPFGGKLKWLGRYFCLEKQKKHFLFSREVAAINAAPHH